MGAFEYFPYTNFHDLNLDWILQQMKNLADQWGLTEQEWNTMQEYINNYFTNLNVQNEIDTKIDSLVSSGALDKLFADYIPYITPEQYGAVGDGVTDDTTALQNAITAAQTTGKLLLGNSAHTYGVYSTITITSPCDIDFNNATIKALSTMTDVISVSSATTGEVPYDIKNIKIECNGLSTNGLHVIQNINVFRFINITIYDMTSSGILCDSGGKFTDITIRNRSNQNATVIAGLRINAPDTVWYNVIVVNCNIGAVVNAVTFMDNFHPWNSFPNIINNSVGASVSNTSLHLTNAYIDTCQTCFSISGGNIFMLGGFLFWSLEYYTGNKTPTITNTGGHLYAIGVRVSSPKGTTNKNVNYSADNIILSVVANSCILEGIGTLPNIYAETAEPTLLNDFTIAESTPSPIIRNTDYTISINGAFTPTENVSMSSRTPIFRMPNGYYNTNRVFYFWGFIGSSLYNTTTPCLMCIETNGNVYLYPPESDYTFPSGNYVFLNFIYNMHTTPQNT